MYSSISRLCLGIACLGVALSAWAESVMPYKSTFFEEAKITVNARARADGFLRVRIQPENGEPLEATIGIAKRMNENDIAQGMTEALDAAAAPNYKVDRNAGEHMKIRKTNRDAPDFAVEISFNSPGFAIILEQTE